MRHCYGARLCRMHELVVTAASSLQLPLVGHGESLTHVPPVGVKGGCNGPKSTRSRPTAAARSGCGILASMFTFRTRRRRWWLGAITTALVVSVAALLLRPMVEHGVRARIESEAVRHGAVARIGVV